MSPDTPPPLVKQILTGLRYRYRTLNMVHYDAAWTDSSVHCRCFHDHPTLIDAAKCGMPHPGSYVIAVERGEPRELTADEHKVVGAFRFGKFS